MPRNEKFEIDGEIVEIKSFGEFRCVVCGEWTPMEEVHKCPESEPNS